MSMAAGQEIQAQARDEQASCRGFQG